MIVQPLLGLLFGGEYRDPEPIRSTWFGNDVITLVVAAPLLLAGHAAALRGSARGLLIWLGLLAYAIYNYGFYLFGAALNAFFPIYVLALVLAAIVLILVLSDTDVARLAGAFRDETPVRAVGGTLVTIGTVLASVWLVIWAAYAFGGRATPLDPEAFKVIAAMDLVLMVPVLTIGGVLLWRRRPWGYAIATIAAIQGALYLLVLSVNSVVAIQRGLSEPPAELPIWGALLIVTAQAVTVLLRNVRSDVPARPSQRA
jgi:hypothetical protein